MGRMKDLIADEWDRAYRQGYYDAIADHLDRLSQIFDSPATSAVQTEQQPSELQGKMTHLLECRHAKHDHAPDPWCDCGILRACEKRVLDAARKVIELMILEDAIEFAYIDLPVPEILAIHKDVLKDTQ